MTHLLAIGAHPDDVEICCGGWLLLARERGQSAVIVDMTRGELATNGTVEQRAQEAQAAAERLGLSCRENLALPDGGLRADDEDQLAAVVGALRRHRPQLLLAPCLEARHPDHTATGQLYSRRSAAALRSTNRPGRKPRSGRSPPSETRSVIGTAPEPSGSTKSSSTVALSERW